MEAALRSQIRGGDRHVRRSWLIDFISFVAAAGAALAFTILLGDRSPIVAVAAGGVAAVGIWLVTSERYTATLALLMLYLGLADGYLKLRFASDTLVLVRDALLYAIVAGAILRWSLSRKSVTLPPLSGWVLAWIVVVLVELANPANGTLSHSVQAVRPHLEFVPLFFLGYHVMRSPTRLRGFLLLLVVVAAVNGVVGTVQFHLSPDQLAGWGPGYADRIEGVGVSGRFFVDTANEQRVRPFGLGSDQGFGGAVGVLACGAALALLYGRHRVALLGAAVPLIAALVLGVVTSQARVAVLGAVIAVLAFLVMATTSRRWLGTLAAVAVTGALAFTVISGLIERSDTGSFDRYSSIAPVEVLNTTYQYRKDTIAEIPRYALDFPLGAGLGTVGPGASTPGGTGRPLNGESQFTFLLVEVGVFGLLVMMGFNVALLVMVARRLRYVADRETRILLAAVAAPLFALFASWIAGASTASTPGSPYLWFAAGTLVYWLTRPEVVAREAAV